MLDLARELVTFGQKYPNPAAHPNGATDNGDPTWDQDCAAFLNRFGEYTTPGWAPRVYGPDAWDVAKASGPLNTDAARAPIGAIHWWRGGAGHVGVDLRGGGTHVAMASHAATSQVAPALGTQSVAGYNRARPSMTYAGWTTNYAGAAFTTGGIEMDWDTFREFMSRWLVFHSRPKGSDMAAGGPTLHEAISTQGAVTRKDVLAKLEEVKAEVAKRGTVTLALTPEQTAVFAEQIAKRLPPAPTAVQIADEFDARARARLSA